MWFWTGMIIGIALLALILWLKNSKGITVRWYEWILVLLAIGAGSATIQHYFSSISAGENIAANAGALIFGLVAIILFAVTWQLVIRHK